MGLIFKKIEVLFSFKNSNLQDNLSPKKERLGPQKSVFQYFLWLLLVQAPYFSGLKNIFGDCSSHFGEIPLMILITNLRKPILVAVLVRCLLARAQGI